MGLDALYALIYAHRAVSHSKLCAEDLWQKNWGLPAFREILLQNRFQQIMRYLIFDVRSIRAERLAKNKFALASEIWCKLIENCQLFQNPRKEITVDKKLQCK